MLVAHAVSDEWPEWDDGVTFLAQRNALQGACILWVLAYNSGLDIGYRWVCFAHKGSGLGAFARIQSETDTPHKCLLMCHAADGNIGAPFLVRF